MKINKFAVSLVMVLMMVILPACGAAPPAAEPVVLPEDPLGGMIAEGTIEPYQSASLSFGVSGLVENVFFNVGDTVKQGDIIARLSTSSGVEGEIQAAQFEYLQVQQALTDLELYAGAERAAALQALIDAKDAFHIAQEDWDDYDIDGYKDDLGDAQEDVQNAQSDLEDAQTDLQAYLNLDEDNRTRERYQDDVDDAESDLHQAESDLADVENDFLQAKHDYDYAVSQLAAAQAEYDKKQDSADTDQKSLLQFQASALQQTITGLQNKLNNTLIIAPFGGIVTKNDLGLNEFSPAGTPQVMLADLSKWIIKTDDVSEYDIAGIQLGQEVTISVDAFPGEELFGSVESIDLVSYVDQGDVTYPVTILINDGIKGLRWGMTASVHFQKTE